MQSNTGMIAILSLTGMACIEISGSGHLAPRLLVQPTTIYSRYYSLIYLFKMKWMTLNSNEPHFWIISYPSLNVHYYWGRTISTANQLLLFIETSLYISNIKMYIFIWIARARIVVNLIFRIWDLKRHNYHILFPILMFICLYWKA